MAMHIKRKVVLRYFFTQTGVCSIFIESSLNNYLLLNYLHLVRRIGSVVAQYFALVGRDLEGPRVLGSQVVYISRTGGVRSSLALCKDSTCNSCQVRYTLGTHSQIITTTTCLRAPL